MKWFTKKSLKRIIQTFLLGYMVFEGFFLTYTWTWWKLGFPDNGWMLVVPCVLAVASSFGLFYWIVEE